jgi:hypothetical protein
MDSAALFIVDRTTSDPPRVSLDPPLPRKRICSCLESEVEGWPCRLCRGNLKSNRRWGRALFTTLGKQARVWSTDLNGYSTKCIAHMLLSEFDTSPKPSFTIISYNFIGRIYSNWWFYSPALAFGWLGLWKPLHNSMQHFWNQCSHDRHKCTTAKWPGITNNGTGISFQPLSMA